MSKTTSTISAIFGVHASGNEAETAEKKNRIKERIAEQAKVTKKLEKRLRDLEKPASLSRSQQNKVKYILGGLTLNLMSEDEALKDRILAKLDHSLEYEYDRKLFGLVGGKKRNCFCYKIAKSFKLEMKNTSLFQERFVFFNKNCKPHARKNINDKQELCVIFEKCSCLTQELFDYFKKHGLDDSYFEKEINEKEKIDENQIDSHNEKV